MSALPASSRDTLLLTALVLLTTVTAIVSSLGAPLVPAIARTYDVPLSSAQWVLTTGLLSGAVSTPILGRLGSGRLRKPVIVAGLTIVTLGSLLAALPVPLPALVLGRACQGVGMGLTPLAIAVARDVVPAARLPRAVALLSVTTVTGAGLGYPLSAWVAQLGGVHAAYALGATLAAGTLAMAVLVVPHLPGADPQPVDWTGALLLSAGMVALLLGVSQGEHWGWDDARVLALLGGGAVVLAAWTAWTLRRAQPLVDLRLATRPGMMSPNLVAVLAGVGMYTLLTTAVVLVQADPARQGWGLGEPVVVSGLLLVPYALASVVGSRLAQRVRELAGPRALLPIGCAVFGVATLGLATFHGSLALALVWMGLGGLGSGFTFSSLAVLMLPFVPASETGSAMAFNQVLRYLGFATGSATAIALMAAFGGGEHGFVAALWTTSLVWLLAGGAAFVLDRRALVRAPAGSASGR
ncbi:MFS transporter [Nocardioides sp. TRM66260-LWL]|uniref:MFS transporter n=1 Tax=Nocardioides sp. TRM66260-LWL TaxID=2874478 RepID=UPI001CC6AAEB|nr:MFS transporter [Nocardioides sp. TRM66260-LWL]MBZ5734971.1 MFS transporter [Nocardioides sp. TRM66260-LWL]